MTFQVLSRTTVMAAVPTPAYLVASNDLGVPGESPVETAPALYPIVPEFPAPFEPLKSMSQPRQASEVQKVAKAQPDEPKGPFNSISGF